MPPIIEGPLFIPYLKFHSLEVLSKSFCQVVLMREAVFLLQNNHVECLAFCVKRWQLTED